VSAEPLRDSRGNLDNPASLVNPANRGNRVSQDCLDCPDNRRTQDSRPLPEA